MVRQLFYILSILALVATFIGGHYWPQSYWALTAIIPLILIGLYDLRSHHNVLRNYPVIGHLRYLFEFIRPEIQQYFVATNLSGRPFNRELRSIVYQRSKKALDTHPFGTEHDVESPNYQFAFHSLNVVKVSDDKGRFTVGGPQCKKPYDASRINISAMSFGALSNTAVLAMNLGAKLGNFAQDTGEGGLTKYHLQNGGDVIWEIGTGYFGCRTKDGHFDPEIFAKKANLDVVKMVEIKLSQGAKPSHGGVLPGVKVSKEIAEFRGVPEGLDCISPPTHSAFSTPVEMMQFIAKLREMTAGKPVGFKLCIGKRTEFMAIVKAMLETKIYPDFITIDGAEGGTGAAPLEFSNRLGTPINEGLAYAHNALVGAGLRDKISLIASGKIITGFDVVEKLALGANMVNIARGMMFAVGCIQALRCHSDTCPTGVTTQNPRRARAIVPSHKAIHVKNYHDATMRSFLDLTGAMGVADPDQLSPEMVFYRNANNESISYADLYHYIEPNHFFTDNISLAYKADWENSRADRF